MKNAYLIKDSLFAEKVKSKADENMENEGKGRGTAECVFLNEIPKKAVLLSSFS